MLPVNRYLAMNTFCSSMTYYCTNLDFHVCIERVPNMSKGTIWIEYKRKSTTTQAITQTLHPRI